MSWLDEMERRDPAYRGALEWSCPACGTVLIEDEGGMWCTACQQRWTWAELGKDDAEWA